MTRRARNKVVPAIVLVWRRKIQNKRWEHVFSRVLAGRTGWGGLTTLNGVDRGQVLIGIDPGDGPDWGARTLVKFDDGKVVSV